MEIENFISIANVITVIKTNYLKNKEIIYPDIKQTS